MDAQGTALRLALKQLWKSIRATCCGDQGTRSVLLTTWLFLFRFRAPLISPAMISQEYSIRNIAPNNQPSKSLHPAVCRLGVLFCHVTESHLVGLAVSFGQDNLRLRSENSEGKDRYTTTTSNCLKGLGLGLGLGLGSGQLG